MIQALHLTNFKCFRNLSLELGSINVLAGTNGSGKSTLLQSLLVVRQSFESGSLVNGRVELNGPYANLGTAREVYCADPISDSIAIGLTSSRFANLNLIAPQFEGYADEYFLRAQPPLTEEVEAFGSFGIFSDPFNYLHAERLGPRKVSDVQTGAGHPLFVGMHGEFAAFVATAAYKERPIDNDSLLLPSENDQEYRTLHFQWPLWMSRIFPGFDVEASFDAKTDQVRLGLSLQRQETGRSLFVRPTNTGFGISFVLGIVIAGLIAEAGTLLIVENPEAHLHPRAQSMVGEFLSRVAAGGAQVVVETHSEHIVNGIRRMAKQGILSPDAARIYFLSKPFQAIEPHVERIEISDQGALSAWPPGFFDQLDSDLNMILE
jgi:predicted ATPase